MPPRGARAVVIGGGVESLVSACLLARAGCETTLVERRSVLGGTRAPWPDAPSTGVPILLDDDAVLDPVVARALGLPEPNGPPVPPAPTLGVVDGGGRVLALSPDAQVSRDAIAARSARDADAYARFTASLDRVSRALAPILQRAPPDRRPGDVWTALLTGRRFLGLSRHEAFALLRWPPMPVADLVEEWFEDASLRALVSTRGLFGVFAGPCSAGTTAVLLLRAAAGGGLVPRAPRVGVRTLIEALGTRARDLGVTIRLDTEATEILVEAHGVAGLRLRDGSHVAADLVVSGVGPTRTLVDLLDPMVLTPDVVRRAMHVRARGTLARALVLVDDPAGLATRDGTPLAPHVALHFVSSVDELERAFDAMKYGGWAERPWLEVRVHPPPAGASAANGPGALSVTAHQIPGAIEDGNWPGAQARLTDTILTTLGHHLPGLSARVVGCHVLTPHDLENELGLAGGHPLHAELALDQLWLARPALGLGGYRAAVAGLYLCGPGTHPGVGPLGTSGLLASRAAFRDLRRSSR